MDFWRFRTATQVCIIYKEAPQYYHYVHFGMNVIKMYFIPNSRNLTQTAADFRCTISLYCERNNLLFSTFLVHSIYCFYCFHRVLAIAILSVRLSVRPSHGWNEIGSRLDLGATLLPLCDPDREFGICQSICMSVCLSILNLA